MKAGETASPHQVQSTAKERRIGFAVLFCSLICIGMGQTLMFSILPPLGRGMGLSEIQVAGIFATNGIAWIIFSPIWGRTSDRIGRRTVILIGFGGYAVSTICLAASTQLGLTEILPMTIVYPLMILSRLIFGLLGSGTSPAAQAWVADRTTAKERTKGMARIAGAAGFGAMIGPALGGLLTVYGFLTPLYVVAALSVLSGILIWRFLPEKTKPAENSGSAVKQRFDRRVLPAALLNSSAGFAMGIGQMIIAYYMLDTLAGLTLQQGATHAGTALMVMSGAALVMQMIVMPRLGYSPDAIIRVGLLCSIGAFIVLIMAGSFFVMLIAMAILGVGVGLAFPATIAAASLAVEADKQGMATGILAASVAAGHISGSMIGLTLYSWKMTAPFIMVIVLLSGAILFSWITQRRRALIK